MGMERRGQAEVRPVPQRFGKNHFSNPAAAEGEAFEKKLRQLEWLQKPKLRGRF